MFWGIIQNIGYLKLISAPHQKIAQHATEAN